MRVDIVVVMVVLALIMARMKVRKGERIRSLEVTKLGMVVPRSATVMSTPRSRLRVL